MRAKGKRRLFVLTLMLFFAICFFAKQDALAAGNIGNVKFAFTDVYGVSQQFDGGADKVKVIIFGGIGSCFNTMTTISAVNAVIDGIDAEDCEIYAFNSVASNTNADVLEFLKEEGISKRILVGQTENAYSDVYSLRIKCNAYATSRIMPSVYIVDKDGNFIDFCGGADSISEITSKIGNAGVIINMLPESDEKDIKEKVMEVKYGQTESRKQLSMINEFRTGSDAWVLNADNTTKTVFSNLKELTYDYDLEKVAMLRAAEIAYSYSHTRPNGYNCFSAYSGIYSASAYGENIACGYPTTESVFDAWREDDEDYAGQGHRRNMLSGNFTTFATGHVTYNGVEFWVQLFGNRIQNDTPSVAEDGAKSVTIEVSSFIKQNDYPSMGGGGNNTEELAHNFVIISSEVIESDEYTCQCEAVERCTGCGTVRYVGRYGAHDMKSEIIKEATCTEEGSRKETCKYCGYSYTYIEYHTGHSYDTGVVKKEASYSSEGEKEFTCTVCGNTKTESIDKLSLSKPSIGNPEVASNGINVSWKAVNGATGYYVYRSINGSKYTKIATVSDLSYLDNGARTNGSKYQYKIVAYVKETGGTVKSAASSVKTVYFLTQPKISSLSSPSSKAIKAKWGKNSKATGYEIELSTSSSFASGNKTVVVKSYKTVSKTIKSLKAKKKYYVRIRTYKTVGGKKYYSAWSAKKTVTTKK